MITTPTKPWPGIFHAYHDGQHGWVAVKRALLIDLGCLPLISRFSYERGATVYLEEDCDVITFIKAYFARFGNSPAFQSHYTKNDRSSRIRSYDAFRLRDSDAS